MTDAAYSKYGRFPAYYTHVFLIHALNNKKMDKVYTEEEVKELLIEALTTDGEGAYSMAWSFEEAIEWVENRLSIE